MSGHSSEQMKRDAATGSKRLSIRLELFHVFIHYAIQGYLLYSVLFTFELCCDIILKSCESEVWRCTLFY